MLPPQTPVSPADVVRSVAPRVLALLEIAEPGPVLRLAHDVDNGAALTIGTTEELFALVRGEAPATLSDRRKALRDEISRARMQQAGLMTQRTYH